jgi:filamin
MLITGSPFTLNVGGEPSGRVRETVTKDINAVSATAPGSKCEFQLKIPGTSPLNMEASLTSPTGKTEMCDIADKEHSLYEIKFVPKEEGVHIVSLKHNGLHISGSPFQYTVGPTPSGGTHKVEIGGPGLERGEVGTNST